MIDRALFERRFSIAIDEAIELARTHVANQLYDRRRFLVFPNQSCDETLDAEESVFPDDSLPDGAFRGPMDQIQVADNLWRNGTVPEWINISVDSVVWRTTYIALHCCGRFTGQIEKLYNQPREWAPFHVVSPPLPPGWDDDDHHDRFDLHWRHRRFRTRSTQQRLRLLKGALLATTGRVNA